MIFVYALMPPDVCEIRYVGQTVNPAQRLLAHQASGRLCATSTWCPNLAEPPRMLMLDVCASRRKALASERAWIERGEKLGWQLLNMHGRSYKSGRDAAARVRKLVASGWTQPEIAAALGLRSTDTFRKWKDHAPLPHTAKALRALRCRRGQGGAK